MEHIQEPNIAGVRRRDDGPSGPTYWVVPDVPASMAPDVPPSRRVRVRDAAGRVVPVRYIGALEHRPDPAHLPPELATFPQGASVGRSVWLVNFMQDPDVLGA